MIAYFEGRLSVEEEINFLNKVADDEDLQKEFDWEMMLRFKEYYNDDNISSEEMPFHFISADEHLLQVKAALEHAGKEKLQKKTTPVLRMKTMAIAASMIFIIGCTLLYFFYFKENPPAVVNQDGSIQTDTGQIFKKEPPSLSTNEGQLLAVKNNNAKKLFKQFYRKYSGTEDDPIEVSKYLYAYNEGNYDDVIRAKPDELASKGGNEDTGILKNYYIFYQGASYLHLTNSKSAIEKFQEVRHYTSEKEQLYYDATWYLAMAYIQNNNLKEAGTLLQQLAATKANLTYKRKAGEILKLM